MTAKSRTTRKEEDRRRREDEILDAALALFAAKGYAGTTIEDIAEELGYAKASLYYYFPGKEAIVKALIYGAMDEADRRMAVLLARTDDPVENLKELIGNYIDDHTNRRGFFNIYHQVGHFMETILSPEESQAMRVSMAAMNEKIIGILRRGIDRGDFLDLNAQTLGEMVLGMLSGLMNQMSLRGLEGFDREALKPTIVEILIRGIRRQENP
jgi:AcrR family transcriptional regulator